MTNYDVLAGAPDPKTRKHSSTSTSTWQKLNDRHHMSTKNGCRLNKICLFLPVLSRARDCVNVISFSFIYFGVIFFQLLSRRALEVPLLVFTYYCAFLVNSICIQPFHYIVVTFLVSALVRWLLDDEKPSNFPFVLISLSFPKLITRNLVI